ncbi:signal peptidase II [Moraxella sp. Tifton1]|uniref:signal peptidase II n=1 Tax=Moraxella oculi TaxID=2940516 RepID=UPI002013A5D3|nr:signal peptidase II [Moraxella sp. Tifton1]MCL1623067.1 signal peptidase II [Moraxella sp. Tifton1]
MPNKTPPSNNPMKYYFIALIILVLDQLTKLYFDHNFELYETVDVIPPVLNWTLAYNHGAAFSFLADQSGWQKWFFASLGLMVAIFITVYIRQVPREARSLSIGLSLVLGGAIGNVIDRILYGHVIDFIHVHYADVWHYPIFNIADIGICIGMSLVMYDMLFLEKKRTIQ